LNQSKNHQKRKIQRAQILEAIEEKDQGGKAADICRKWGISILGLDFFLAEW
jgi:hypothetical protein